MPIRNWRELQSLVGNKQSGLDIDTTGKSWLDGWDPTSPDAQDDYEKRMMSAIGNPRSRMSDIVQGRNQILYDDTDLTDVALDYGYGERRQDYDIPFNQFIRNPQEARANAQSQAGKLLNGTIKMLPYAATTFLDNTVGLFTGLINVGIDAANGGEFNPTDSFIHNQFSDWMDDIRNWSERALPNYRTQEEIDDADRWWKHLNGNFWGDVFLKNLGFTIGAGAAGMVYAKGFQGLQGKTMDKAYKAAVAAAAGDADAQAAFQKVLQGGRMQDPKKIYDTFAKTQRSFERLGWQSQIIGGLGGAVGESRVEAMNAAKEFREQKIPMLSREYELNRFKLQKEVADKYTVDMPVYDGFGNVVGTQKGISEDGQAYYDARLRDLQRDYDQKVAALNNEAEILANTTFWMNVPVLWGSNAIFFGRMFSGGRATQARTKVGGKFGSYKQSGSIANAIGLGLKNAATEGMEEMTQKMISEGTKDIAGYNLASFHNGKYDKDAIKDVASYVTSMLSSAGNVLVDPTSWEEFAVGALTGALGMPTKGGWSGGIVGGIKEGIQQRNDSRELAEELNKTIASDEFKKRWEGLVRHQHYENIKDIALNSKVNGVGETIKDASGREVGKQFAWHTANDAQIINDVMMFADAGRLDELESYAEAFGRINEKDLADIDSLISNEDDPTFSSKSKEQKLAWLHKRANDVKDAIRQYRDFYDSVDFLSMGTSDPEAIQELIFTQSQLRNFEKRYDTLLSQVVAEIKPRLEEISKERDRMDNFTERAKQAQEILQSEDTLRRLFGGYALDIHDRDTDAKPILEMLDAQKMDKVLNTLDSWGAFTGKPAVKQQVKDLQELVIARQKYYARLFDPKHREKFQQAAIPPETVVDDLMGDARQNQVNKFLEKLDAANTLAEYANAYDALDDMDKETENMLRQAIDKNPKLKAFENTIQRGEKFVRDIGESIELGRELNEDASLNPEYDRLVNTLQEFDLLDVLNNKADDEDVSLAVARTLLPKVSGKAEQILRQIIEEKLGDAARAAGYGVIPGTGEGSGEGEGGGEGEGNGQGGGQGGGGNVSQYDRLNELIDKIADFHDTDLKRIAGGDFSSYPGLEDEQMLELSAKAQSKINDLMVAAGIIPTKDGNGDQFDEMDDDDPRKIKVHQDLVDNFDSASISGSRFSVYHPGDLKKGRVRRFQSSNSGTNATLNWLVKHKVQDFIDSGALADLEKAYRTKHNGEKLPIYFLANPHYVDNNLDANPFVVQYTDKKDGKKKLAPNIMLAVEMNDENRDVLSNYESHGVFSDETLLTVNEGNESTQYQVIGMLWNPTEKELKDKEKIGEREKYEKVKEESQKIWGYAAGESIIPHYQDDIRKQSSAAFGPEGRWYVARIHPEGIQQDENPDWTIGDRMFTTLNYIMSGRNNTRAVGSDEYKKIPIRDALGEYWDYEKDVYFAIPKNDEVVYTEDSPRIDPSIYAPPGSLWMATQEANGNWAWTHLTIARTNEFDFEENKNTALGQTIESALDVILDPNNQFATKQDFSANLTKRINACRILSNLIYLGAGNTFRFSYVYGTPVLYIGGAQCADKAAAYAALRNGEYRFQIKGSDLNDDARMAMFIDAGVLRSEMRSFIRRGATIGVNFMDDKDADGNHVDIHVVNQPVPVARTAGEAVEATLSDDGSVKNIQIKNAGYQIHKNGAVTRMGSRFSTGERVEDPAIVAQVKAIADLLSSNGAPGGEWKQYVIDTPGFQFATLYERNIDGYQVHVGRRGENGAYMPIFNDEEWESLKEVAKLVEKTSYKPDAAAPAPAPTQRELEEAYDDAAAETEGGKAIHKGGVKPKGRQSRLDDIKAMLEEDDDDDIDTVQDKTKKGAKEQNDNNCG